MPTCERCSNSEGLERMVILDDYSRHSVPLCITCSMISQNMVITNLDTWLGRQPGEAWGFCLDDMANDLWGMKSDSTGSHYITATGSLPVARKMLMERFGQILDKLMYRANSYGTPWEEGDDDEDEDE